MRVQKLSRQIILLISLSLISSTSAAQVKRGGPPPPKPPSDAAVAEMIQEVTETLSLSPAQEKQIAALYKEHFQQERNKMAADKKSRQKHHDFMVGQRSVLESKIKAVLTDKQIKRYINFLEQHRPKYSNQRSRK